VPPPPPRAARPKPVPSRVVTMPWHVFDPVPSLSFSSAGVTLPAARHRRTCCGLDVAPNSSGTTHVSVPSHESEMGEWLFCSVLYVLHPVAPNKGIR
jgi:hypothetical protein